MRRVRVALSYALATAALVACPPLSAQQYPTKPVKIIVAFPPGGSTDSAGRFFGQRLTTVLGQPVIVENKPGASGVIGTEAALKAPPDGYTLTMISSTYATVAAVSRLSFDPIGDITPIIQISHETYVVAATPSLPVKNVQELIALPKPNPGKPNFPSPGPGAPSHLAADLFRTTTRMRMKQL